MVCDRIRKLREDANMTQEQLVSQLNMHKTTYTNYEQGKHTIPFEFMVRLAKFYNVSLDYLAGITNDKKQLSEHLTDYEFELIIQLRKLEDIDKGRVLGYAVGLTDK